MRPLPAICARLRAIVSVASLLPRPHAVTHIHWGGGSPNVLTAGDIGKIAGALRDAFSIDKRAEFAVEIDPRHVDAGKVAAFVEAGVTRVSVGVQDFHPAVQAAVGREQSFEMTKRIIQQLRHYNIASINVDLMYGLPRQTLESVDRTITQVLESRSRSDRRFRLRASARAHETSTADRNGRASRHVERFTQSNRVGRRLVEHGYVRIDLDHFAKPSDALVTAPIARNFQGYTTDQAATLIGIGASAIGRLPQGYVQNSVAVGDYERRMRSYGLATAKGRAFTDEDRMRGYVIERLMCDLAFSVPEVRRRFGAAADVVIEEAKAVIASDQHGLVAGTAGGFMVTERGRPFIRSIRAHFDAYLDRTSACHAAGV
jgi:oxygen-independent coproporphyrinogen III oxidase